MAEVEAPELDELHRPPSPQDMGRLQFSTLLYYLHETNPDNGLVRDKTDPERAGQHRRGRHGAGGDPGRRRARLHHRARSPRRSLAADCASSGQPAGAGAGRHRLQGLLLPLPRHEDRAGASGTASCRRIDSAFLLAGVLTAADLLRRRHAGRARDPHARRRALPRASTGAGRRTAAPTRHARLDAGDRLPAATAGRATTRRCCSTCSASARRPIRCRRESYAAWASTYQWKTIYGHELLYSGPLFTHQFSHVWIDFRGIQDAFMREHGIDYFENSRRATYRAAASTRSATRWTSRATANTAGASPPATGPGWITRDGRRHRAAVLRLHRPRRAVRPRRRHHRAVGGGRSLPFAPEIVLPTIKQLHAHGSRA